MRDILFLAIVVGFFALGAAYIRACAAIVGRDSVVDLDPTEPADPTDPTDPSGADHEAAGLLR